jgi:hypothetical protein
MRIKDFYSSSSGEPVSNKLKYQLNDVINYGVGLQYNFNDMFAGYSSFITDYSAVVDEKESKLTTSNWDIYHLTIGSTLKIKQLDFTLGLGFAFGKESNQQLLNLTDVHERNALLGTRDDSEVTFTRVKFIFGFSYLF